MDNSERFPKTGMRVHKKFRVLLACGCAVRLADNPKNPRWKSPCSGNMGHGYRVAWQSWTDEVTGNSRTNLNAGAK